MSDAAIRETRVPGWLPSWLRVHANEQHLTLAGGRPEAGHGTAGDFRKVIGS